jgi:hypothetical protein
MVECYRQGNTDSSTRAFWQSYQRIRLIAKQEKLANEVMNFVLRNISFHTSKGSLTFRKILRPRADSFTSHLKEGLLPIFIAHEIHVPWSGLNPRTLGPVASTVTI